MAFGWKKILVWSERGEKFVKRAALALIARLAWHDKGEEDEKLIELFAVIKGGATDERNFVKKAGLFRNSSVRTASIRDGGQRLKGVVERMS